MKRYMLFAWWDDEVLGGMNDLIDSEQTLGRIKKILQKLIDKDKYDSYHIYDTKLNRFVGDEYIPIEHNRE